MTETTEKLAAIAKALDKGYRPARARFVELARAINEARRNA